MTIGALQLAARHHVVECEARAMTLAEPEPADPRRQALERDALAGEIEPARERAIVGKELAHLAIGFRDVRRIAG